VLVTIDGRYVDFIDQGPTIVDGRTLVPVRGVFEELGFEVDWEQDMETARLTRNGYEVALTIGSAIFITNGESHTLDVPAQVIGGRTMLPIRAVLESVGYSVDWSQSTNTVLISSSSGKYTNENRFSSSDGINENGFWEGVTALNYVEMFDYENMEIPNDVHHVSDEEIEREIQDFLFQFPPRIMNRAVNEGDVISIDIVGSVDGLVFESGRNVYVDVILGQASHIDELLEQLIGHMPGDTVNIQVTLPDDYLVNLAGKDALFVTTINFITSKELSELTDEYVLKNFYNLFGWRTIVEMEEGLRIKYQSLLVRIFIEDFIRYEVNVSSIPEKLISYHEQSFISPYREIASELGISLEEYVEMIGYSNVDELLEEIREMNLVRARRSLILQAIAEHGGFTANGEDVGDFFEKNFGSRDYSSFEEELGLPYIMKLILQQKVFEHIIENAILL